MSSSSRRKKEPASGGGKVTAVSSRSISAGKENSRPTTRLRAAAQKRSNVQIDDEPKSAAVEEPRVGKDSSSVARGRNSSPFQSSKQLLDTRRSSRVAARNVNNANGRASKKFGIERKRGSKVLEIVGGNLHEIEGTSQENDKIEITKGEIGGIDVNNVGVSVKSCDQEVKISRDMEKDEKALDKLDANYPDNARKKIKIGSSDNEKMVDTWSSKSSKNKALKETKGESSLRELHIGKKGDTGGSKNKDRVKLHEKLAYLEAKVKRIASDIEQTKYMLDLENLEASEMILSEINERIAGIEKVVAHVGHDGDSNMGFVKSDENDNKEEDMAVVDAKSLVKNGVEAGARLSCDMLNTENDRVISLNVNAVVDAEISEGDNVRGLVAETSSPNDVSGKDDFDALLMADEKLNDFDHQEKVQGPGEEFDESYKYQLNDIGCKSSTAGWFVSEGESVILAHDDGSCSFYDIINTEVKAEYKPPVGVSPNTWRDCWIIHAPSGDGCSGKYVVAASAGNSVDPGFCSWDFYTKDVKGFHINDGSTLVRTALAPLPNDPMFQSNPPSSYAVGENRQWWYKPCGPLIVSSASCQRMVQIYDIRDGDQLVEWELSKPVVSMDYASPLHWKSKGKVVVAESAGLSLWDVSTPSSHALQLVSSSGERISALHVNNIDAEQGGGLRQRIRAPEAEGNDGVFCTTNFINILDFRQPSGIGLKIPKLRLNAQSVFSYGDSIYIGCTGSSSIWKNHSSQIQLFSLRKQKLLSTHQLPESNAHHSFNALTQVWGNSNLVMGICGLGLFVFNSFNNGDGNPQPDAVAQNMKEVIGPDNMYCPSFDYVGSRVLLISRDRPACWRYLF